MRICRDGKIAQLKPFNQRQKSKNGFNVGIEKCVPFGKTVIHPENSSNKF